MPPDEHSARKPTIEEIREARHMGFLKALNHYPAELQERMLKIYQVRDARREDLIGRFVRSLQDSHR